jgi:hypothetical protein
MADHGRCHPAISDGIRQRYVRERLAMAWTGRRDLGDDAVAIGHQNRFAFGRQTDVRTQLVFSVRIPTERIMPMWLPVATLSIQDGLIPAMVSIRPGAGDQLALAHHNRTQIVRSPC